VDRDTPYNVAGIEGALFFDLFEAIGFPANVGDRIDRDVAPAEEPNSLLFDR
jgi:hypothetical protein